jgi:ATP-dependent helicase/DNAse subunit B
MKRRLPLPVSISVLCFAVLMPAQRGSRTTQDPPFPQLKADQIERLIKDDHQKSLKDATELMKLVEELRIDLEKKDPHVLSITALKKTEEIEKVAKRIRDRMKRY